MYIYVYTGKPHDFSMVKKALVKVCNTSWGIPFAVLLQQTELVYCWVRTGASSRSPANIVL